MYKKEVNAPGYATSATNAPHHCYPVTASTSTNSTSEYISVIGEAP